jgi:hypothetical protein
MFNQSSQSLFEQVKGEDVAKDKSAAHYLTQQRQRAALTRLPEFEGKTGADIECLRQEIWRLHRLIGLVMVLLLATTLVGGLLCLL